MNYEGEQYMPQNNILNNNNYIYVAFLTSPTKIGKTIRYITKNKYNHVTLSFEKNLRTMYSFARYNVNTPLIGGFVEESSLRYYYFKKSDIPVKICKIPLTTRKLQEVMDYIASMEKNSKQYIYNLLSFAAAPLHRKILVDKSFTCHEFVYNVLYNCGIVTSININKYFTILDLENALEKYVVYEGNLEKPVDSNDWGNDLFCSRKSVPKVLTGSLKHCGSLIKRTIIS